MPPKNGELPGSAHRWARRYDQYGRAGPADRDPLTATLIHACHRTSTRYERDQPGEPIHLDAKKPGRTPTTAVGVLMATANRPADEASAMTTSTPPSTTTLA